MIKRTPAMTAALAPLASPVCLEKGPDGVFQGQSPTPTVVGK